MKSYVLPLHQPASVFRSGGPTIHPDMLTPLLIMALAYMLFFVTTLLMRMRAELAAQRLEIAAERRAMALEGVL